MKRRENDFQKNTRLTKFTGIQKDKAVYALTEGKPQKEIKKYAENQEIDLIIMAVRGMSTLEHFLVGSTTEMWRKMKLRQHIKKGS